MGPTVDWNADARDNANRIQRDMPGSGRGAFQTDAPGVCVAYGNDDCAGDHHARLEVTLLRQYLDDGRIRELGFGTSDDGRTWCMMVQSNDADGLTDALLDAWRIAFEVKGDGTVG